MHLDLVERPSARGRRDVEGTAPPDARWGPPLAALVLLAAVLAAPGSAGAQEAAGQWSGAVQPPGARLDVVVDLAPAEEGWRGVIDIPAQAVTDRPLSDISVRGDSVVFSISGVPGRPTFRGALTAGGDSLSGQFSQAGQTFPFRLARSGEPQLAPAPPSGEGLADFDDFVERTMEAWSVPGAAVAIVEDGEVVHSRGYGVRNLRTGEPVTPRTVMPIGSSTKAFTALLVGLLVEEGELAWDEPIRTWLPDFELQSDFATRQMTPVDLLTHRSGLPRHDLLWYGSPLERRELYGRLSHLEPSADFRTSFQYNNLMYMTAGLLAGHVTGSTWEEQVRSRILEPLGMEDTSVDVDGLTNASEVAVGYREEAGGADGENGDESTEGELVPMDYREIDAVGPAGSINSTAEDMVAWVRLQLAGGRVDGVRVAPEAVVRETQEPEVVVQGGVFSTLLKQPEMPYLMYGLGWFVQPYRGHRMIHHGGNIDGFSALVSFLPDEDVGVVVLTNRNGTSLPTVLALGAFDRLLDLEPIDWSSRYQSLQRQLEQAREAGGEIDRGDRIEGTSPSHPLADYVGTYRHPGYGELEIRREGEELVARYHDLRMALDHWHYDVFRGELTEPVESEFRFRFEGNLRGDVASVLVPLESQVSPIEFERQPPASMRDAAFLRRFEGEYELMGMTVRVRTRGERLTMTVPGQPTYELVPYRDTRFDLRDRDGYSVEFVVEGGEVTGAVIRQPGATLRAEKRD